MWRSDFVATEPVKPLGCALQRFNYALAGMLVSGSAQKAQFIKISLITEALKG